MILALIIILWRRRYMMRSEQRYCEGSVVFIALRHQLVSAEALRAARFSRTSMQLASSLRQLLIVRYSKACCAVRSSPYTSAAWCAGSVDPRHEVPHPQVIQVAGQAPLPASRPQHIHPSNGTGIRPVGSAQRQQPVPNFCARADARTQDHGVRMARRRTPSRALMVRTPGKRRARHAEQTR